MTPAAIVQSGDDGVVLAGIVSFTTTPAGSVEGPLFVMAMLYVVDDPAATVEA
jgi:hypothetical protein